MNCRTIITAFYLLFFSTQIIAAEVGIQDNTEIGFIQDTKGRKWQVIIDKENNMLAQYDNEKVKVANYIPCITRKLVSLSNYIYVLYLIDGHTIKIGEMVSSEKRLEEAPTIYK